jgi:iron(III) transport system substrate-binding protein
MQKKYVFYYGSCVLFAVLVFWTGSCRNVRRDAVHSKNALIIASPHPLVLIIPVVENFENETGIDVRIIQGGTGEIIQNIRRYPDSAPYDLLWGGSYSTVLPVASLFENYTSTNESFMQPVYRNVEGSMNRFSDIPSVIMINRKRLGSIPVTGYGDLLDPRLKGTIAFCDPEKSSSAWEHLVNMLYAVGAGNPEKGWPYVEKFCSNLDGILLDGSKDVYEGVAEGKFTAGLTFEEGGANYAVHDSNIGLVYMKEGVVFTPDGVYLLKNSPHSENAKRFIDYATGFSVQSYISKQMNRRSVRTDVPLHSLFPSKKSLPCIAVNYTFASSHKDEWILRFHEIFDNAQKEAEYE